MARGRRARAARATSCDGCPTRCGGPAAAPSAEATAGAPRWRCSSRWVRTRELALGAGAPGQPPDDCGEDVEAVRGPRAAPATVAERPRPRRRPQRRAQHRGVRRGLDGRRLEPVLLRGARRGEGRGPRRAGRPGVRQPLRHAYVDHSRLSPRASASTSRGSTTATSTTSARSRLCLLGGQAPCAAEPAAGTDVRGPPTGCCARAGRRRSTGSTRCPLEPPPARRGLPGAGSARRGRGMAEPSRGARVDRPVGGGTRGGALAGRRRGRAGLDGPGRRRPGARGDRAARTRAGSAIRHHGARRQTPRGCRRDRSGSPSPRRAMAAAERWDERRRRPYDAALALLASTDEDGPARRARPARRPRRRTGGRDRPPQGPRAGGARQVPSGRPAYPRRHPPGSPARAGGAGPPLRGAHQRRDRRPAVPLGQDGRPPRLRGAREARRGLPARGGRRAP